MKRLLNGIWNALTVAMLVWMSVELWGMRHEPGAFLSWPAAIGACLGLLLAIFSARHYFAKHEPKKMTR